MIDALKKLTNSEPSASASVVDGKLILSCPNAVTPVVWQMDLSDVKASAMEVLEDEGNFTLNLKTAKGERLKAATFATREDAVAGLMAASQALENAQGRIHASAAANEDAPAQAKTPLTPVLKKRRRNRFVISGLGVLLLIVMIGMWNAVVMREPRSFPQELPRASAAAPAAAGGAANSSGVPVSADDFLNSR